MAHHLGLIPRPIDPWEEIAKPWVGDWAGLRAAADVLNNVRWATNDVGINIQWRRKGRRRCGMATLVTAPPSIS